MEWVTEVRVEKKSCRELWNERGCVCKEEKKRAERVRKVKKDCKGSNKKEKKKKRGCKMEVGRENEDLSFLECLRNSVNLKEEKGKKKKEKKRKEEEKKKKKS